MSNQRIPAPTRLLPVRPDLDQLKHQARELLRRVRGGDTEALAQLNSFHPQAPRQPSEIKLAHAQLALARIYGASSWPRLVQSCKLIDAIWRDDLDVLRDEGVREELLGSGRQRGVRDGRQRAVRLPWVHADGVSDARGGRRESRSELRLDVGRGGCGRGCASRRPQGRDGERHHEQHDGERHPPLADQHLGQDLRCGPAPVRCAGLAAR